MSIIHPWRFHVHAVGLFGPFGPDRRLSRWWPSLLLALLVVSVPGEAEEALRLRLEQLRAQPAATVAEVALAAVPVLEDFYRVRGHAFAWRRRAQVEQLQTLARQSRAHGLEPVDFHLRESLAALAGQAPEQLEAGARVEADLLLSDSLLRLLHHFRFGKVDPHRLDGNWNYDEGPAAEALTRDLQRALEAEDLGQAVSAMWQPPGFYTRLQEGLARYRALAAAGGWPNLPQGPVLKPGMRDSRVPRMRERLRITGDYPAGEAGADDDEHYDAALERAVRAFQARHALGVDGMVGPATQTAMNRSAESRIAQIRVNLERMRWVGEDRPDDYVLVDIAAQEVALYRNGQRAWVTRAIVGRPERQTPVFRDRIEYLEFNPSWTVPPTILKEDVLPRARQDPNTVRRKGLEVINRHGKKVAPETVNWNLAHDSLPYRLRQPPGPDNALGQVKFMFPNRHSVYLHDTPHRALFRKARRTFSSGCVRVERPLELAERLLADPQWNPERFAAVLASGRPLTVPLTPPIPVLLSYWTAEADEQGVLHFREDIYARDAAVLAALDSQGPLRLVYPEAPSPASPVRQVAASGREPSRTPRAN